MLHSKKSQSILQWYNSLTTKGNVNSLEQFTDGSHFYEIVASLQPLPQGRKESNLAAESVIFSETNIACNEEVITSVEEEATEGKMEASVSVSVNPDPFVIKESDHTDTHKKYDVVRKFIDEFHQIESSSLIDYGECQKGKELELAKVAVFLLSAMVQNLLSSEDDLVYNTTLLEPEVQENIRDCLALIIDEKDAREHQIKKSDLHKVLSRTANCKTGTPVRKQPPRSAPDPNDLSEGVKSVLKKRKERPVTVYENLQDSPLKILLESPKIQYKAAILRKDSELKKLRSALDMEENRVTELILEKQNLNNELEKRRKELEFYKKELESQREALSEKEEQEKLRAEELKDKKIEEEKLKKLIESQEEEIKQLKENNEALQEKVVDIEKKLEQNETASLIKENNNLKDTIKILEHSNEEKDEAIKALNEKIASSENDLKKYHQMLQDFSASKSRRELRSPNVPETLSTIIYADKKSRETGTLERKEQEPRQDLETKDERIKRLPRKGEMSKIKSPNAESLQIMVNSLRECVSSLEQEKNTLKQRLERFALQDSNDSLMKKIEDLKQEIALEQEKYIHMEKLAKKKDEDVKKALLMYQKIAKLDKRYKDSKKECGEDCEKLRRRCKQLNDECLDFEQETGELKRSIKHLEGMMENLRFEIRELKKEKKELQQKLWEETSALSRNTTDRDALVLHYLKKSKHEPKRNRGIKLTDKEEQKASSRPIIKVDAYILSSENEQSMSNSVLASRSIPSSYFQVADEDDFLNESSLAEIHNGGFQEGEFGENRLMELQRRNTLCPPHLQSSYPLEIQNMTPSERKYYKPEEVSFGLSRKSSQNNGQKDIMKKPKSKYLESDSDDLDNTHSFPVKKRKISETDRISVPVSKKLNQPSSGVGKGFSKENPRKPSTPLKRVAAFVKRKSFRTPTSVNRLMKLQRKIQ